MPSEILSACVELHRLAWAREVFRFPFDIKRIPRDGIYLLFEEGEQSHGGRRIVRVGTHTGEGQLRSRLQQHFLKEAKDRSIFRKNLGRCLLAKAQDPYLAVWETDLTSSAARGNPPKGYEKARQLEIERDVSQRLREKFSFVTIPVTSKADRLRLESGVASLLYACPDCRPSAEWLGRHSPKELIRDSGLWQVNELRKIPLSLLEVEALLAG